MLFGAFFMTLYSTANLIKYSRAAGGRLDPTPGGAT
jgi:hypothetical protein